MTMHNIQSLMRKLEKLGGDKSALIRGIRQGTFKVQGDAKLLAPVGETGQLRNSIQADVDVTADGAQGRVHTNLEYAAYVEFGTGQRGEGSPSPPKSPEDLSYRQDWAGMPAQPYLYPAAKQNEKVIPELVAKELQKEIRKLSRRRR